MTSICGEAGAIKIVTHDDADRVIEALVLGTYAVHPSARRGLGIVVFDWTVTHVPSRARAWRTKDWLRALQAAAFLEECCVIPESVRSVGDFVAWAGEHQEVVATLIAELQAIAPRWPAESPIPVFEPES